MHIEVFNFNISTIGNYCKILTTIHTILTDNCRPEKWVRIIHEYKIFRL